MARPVQENPQWAAPTGSPKALTQGLWAGAAAVVLLVVSGVGGDAGLVVGIVLTAVPPGSLLLLGPFHVVSTRRATRRWLSFGAAWALLGVLAWSALSWVLPRALPLALPWDLSDQQQVAVPTLAGCLLGAERLAALGRLAWRDRALGAAAGYAIVGGVFLVGWTWLSWAVLLGLLAVRAAPSARLAAAVLAGAAALGLRDHVADLWLGRALEWTAFLAYAAAALALARWRTPRPLPVAAAA